MERDIIVKIDINCRMKQWVGQQQLVGHVALSLAGREESPIYGSEIALLPNQPMNQTARMAESINSPIWL